MQFAPITVDDREAAAKARDAYMAAARRSRSAMDRALAALFSKVRPPKKYLEARQKCG
jgi:hypothetical protein